MALLGSLLGSTALTWTATGLSALLAHGAWPDSATFTRAPMALRALFTDPRDLPGAWPDTPAEQLSGPGLFWGVLIGQLMVLVTLAIAALTTVARSRARRAAKRAGTAPLPRPRQPRQDLAAQDMHHAAGSDRDGGDAKTDHDAETDHADEPPVHGVERTPLPTEAEPVPAVSAAPPVPPAAADVPGRRASEQRPSNGAAPGTPIDRYAGLVIGPVGHKASPVMDALHSAAGPALVVTADPALWAGTAGARAKLGPTYLYDPCRLTDAPMRLRWAPHRGCEAMDTARSRATALLAPVRPRARGEAAMAEAAETLLRCCLHAAALSDAPFRQVHRWATSSSLSEAVRTLRTHTAAASGSAGELESVLIAHPERRDAAMALVRRALSGLSRLPVRNACTASRADSVSLESFIAEGGTLYLMGDAIEDPHLSEPGAMPFLTALTSSVVEHGRRMAARSSPGRLDPPLTVILDGIAVVAPIPELPSLLADGAATGMPTVALLRSEEQLHTWWPSLATAASDGYFRL